jgi:putative transposase
MDAVIELAPGRGLAAAACAALGVSRASLHRRRARRTGPVIAGRPRPSPRRALAAPERQAVLDLLHEPRFVDLAPAEIYASLLDQGRYVCSIRTLYRILAENHEVRERRRQMRHPVYVKPELLATGPNQVWSWDITKLMGPVKWTYFYLYVIIDIFSRRVVGWLIADAESAALFQPLFQEALARNPPAPGVTLILHADRGSAMKAKATALMLADLGVTKSHSRPYVSDDNPFSESHFKTLKYQPQFPSNFGCIQDAKAFCRRFFAWYNQDHHHVGIGLMTPDQVHYGQAQAVHDARQKTLERAYRMNPDRFVKKAPAPPAMPTATWINPPKPFPNTQSIQPANPAFPLVQDALRFEPGGPLGSKRRASEKIDGHPKARNPRSQATDPISIQKP